MHAVFQRFIYKNNARQCLEWNIHSAREDQKLQKDTPVCRGGEEHPQNTCQQHFDYSRCQKGPLYAEDECAANEPNNLNTKVTIHNSQAGRFSGAKHVLEYTEKTCMPHVSQPLKWLTVLQYNSFQLLKSSDEQEAMIQLIMPARLGILEMRPGCWFYDISTLQKRDWVTQLKI